MIVGRIQVSDEEIEKFRPLIAFLDSIPDSRFVKTIDTLTQGYGTGFEGVTACLFPDELDEYMIARGEGFENGVQFIFFEDEIVVDIDTFWKYLRMACEVYWQKNAQDKNSLESFLVRPKPSLEMSSEVAEWMRKWKAGEYNYLQTLEKIEK